MSGAARHVKLDKKQHQAFQIICCTFMLSWLDEFYTKENHRQVFGIISDGTTGQLSNDYKEVVKVLNDHGARCNLFFFLGGAGGSGNSHSVYLQQLYLVEGHYMQQQ
eukprot:3164403-Ditylum_brightwellii.AAC.1